MLSRLLSMEIPKRSRYEALEISVNFTPGLDAMIQEKLLDPPSKRIESFIQQRGPPIIIVPQNVTACITKYNAKKFLEGDGFELTQELLDAGTVKPQRLIVQRHIPTTINQPGKPHPGQVPDHYEIIDSVFDLKIEEWDRVVCVFAIGKEWQFRNFKWANHKELFNHVPGAYVFNSKEPSFEAKLTNGWAVKRLDIGKFTRDSYKAFLDNLWLTIDAHILQKKTWYVTPKPYW